MLSHVLAAALWLGHATAADQVVGGPIVVNVSGKAATVVWVVKDGEAKVGISQDAMGTASPALRAEKVGFTGLKPGTTYFYDVSGAESRKGSFKTPPAGNEPYEFVVFGDTRTRHDMHRRVIEAMLKYSKPEFVLHTGDLVSDGNDSSMWPIFFDIEKDLLRKVAYFPALGNHERNSRIFYDLFQVTTPYYSFDWGKAHFVVMNSDIGNVASNLTAKQEFWAQQKAWLEEDLQKSQGADFRFVIAHHPPITAVSSRQAGNPEMQAMIPLFEKYKVTGGFFGHDHNYQHYLKNGIHYVVTGGGGAPLYDVSKPADGITQKVTSTEHFVRIRYDGSVMKVTAIALDGTTLDEYEMSPAKSK